MANVKFVLVILYFYVTASGVDYKLVPFVGQSYGTLLQTPF